MEMLRSVQRFNVLLLAALILGAWYAFSWPVARSILIGGVLANLSFFLLGRDITLFIANFSNAGGNENAVRRAEKIKFFAKFYGRLVALGVILCLLITKVSIDVIGLIIGLSTIMCSVIVVVLSRGSMLYSAQRYKGA